LWTTKLKNDYYGDDSPAIRLAGFLPGIQKPARLIAKRKPNLTGGALNGRSEIRSIPPSSVQATSDLLHSACDFRTPVQCEKNRNAVTVITMMQCAAEPTIGIFIIRRIEKLYVHRARKDGVLLDARIKFRGQTPSPNEIVRENFCAKHGDKKRQKAAMILPQFAATACGNLPPFAGICRLRNVI
jgi:hypothetical protein